MENSTCTPNCKVLNKYPVFTQITSISYCNTHVRQFAWEFQMRISYLGTKYEKSAITEKKTKKL